MSDNLIRHFISAIGVLIAAAFFFAGYFAGVNRWWVAGISVIFVYLIVYKLVDAGGH